MVVILIMSAKLATLGLLKIKFHQQNFITGLKLYCRCGHVTKVW